MNFDAFHPTEEALRAIDIHNLLPQQEPFVMVGKLVFFNEKLTITETLITKDNLFVEEERFTPSGLIENIAQTCAARIGYVNKFILKKGIQLGYLGAIRNLEITNTPAVGSLITTRMEMLDEVFGMLLAQAEIICNNQTIVSAEIKIAIAKGE